MMWNNVSNGSLQADGYWKKLCVFADKPTNRGGLLSNCDLAEMFHTYDSQIACLLADYEL